MMKTLFGVAVIAVCGIGSLAAGQSTRTIIYDGAATEVAVAPNHSNGLWITTQDLTRATRFVIKPQGVCRDQLCFPLPKNRKAEFVAKKGTTTWFNLSEFAKLIKQPVAFDQKNGERKLRVGQGAVARLPARQSVERLGAQTALVPNLTVSTHSDSERDRMLAIIRITRSPS